MLYEYTNAYYFRHLNKIGGIESHLKYVAMKYSKYDIAIFYQSADKDRLNELEKYARCIQLDKEDFVKCKVLFCCFNREILNQCEAEKKYLVLHGDYKDMVLRKQLNKDRLPIDPRIDEYLGVSQLVCDSWEEMTGIKAKNVLEPVVVEKSKPLMFVSATRLTSEKGYSRMVKLAEALDKAGVNYTWFIYTNSQKLPTENMVFLPPRMDVTNKIGGYDAFIQLSDNEGFCLAIVEALMQGVPVIATDLPVLKELGVNKGNSVILPFDMSDIPIDKIRNITALKFDYKPPKDKWGSVIDHTLKKDELIEVTATVHYKKHNIVDTQLGRIPLAGEKWLVTKKRYEDLLKFSEKRKIRLIQ